MNKRFYMIVAIVLLIVVGVLALYSLRTGSDAAAAGQRIRLQTQESIVRTEVVSTLTAAASPP